MNTFWAILILAALIVTSFILGKLYAELRVCETMKRTWDFIAVDHIRGKVNDDYIAGAKYVSDRLKKIIL